MKGQFAIAIIGLIFTFTSVIAMSVFLFILKYHLAINLNREYEYSNAQLTLLSLVSAKYNEDYSMYRVLSERNSNGFDEDMRKKILDDLGLLTQSKCFRIVNETATVLEKPDCPAEKNLGEIYIFRPYTDNGLVEKLVLVYE